MNKSIVAVVSAFFFMLLLVSIISLLPFPPSLPSNSNSNSIPFFRFNNYVVIQYGNAVMVKKNEATDYAKELLLKALIGENKDSIRQYIPVELYSEESGNGNGNNGFKNITDRFEYHSLIEVKTFVTAIRLLLIPEQDITISKLVVKSEHGQDLFTLNVSINVMAQQPLYIIWYIQIQVEGLTDKGASMLLSALSYAGEHERVESVGFLYEIGNILWQRSEIAHGISTLELKSEFNSNSNGNSNGNNGSNNGGNGEGNNDNNTHKSIAITAVLKNKTMKEYKVTAVALLDSMGNVILSKGLENAIVVKPFDRVNVKVVIGA